MPCYRAIVINLAGGVFVVKIACLSLAMIACSAAQLSALEHVVFKRDGKQHDVAGKLLVTAADGGLLLLAPDGVLWTIQPDEIVDRSRDDEAFVPLGPDELAKQLLAQLPAGFETHKTAHYLICHNTSRAYASWCGALFERLHRGFVNFWTRKGMKLSEPQFPLVAIVFANRESYLEYSQTELGASSAAIIGYYSLRSNQMTMYDLTGVDALRKAGDRRASAAHINQMLARPEAEQLVATIIHEATHQIAFNCGMHARFADIPLWVSEGIAVYFETPDLESAKGWRSIGAVNRSRLTQLRQYLPQRSAGSLKSLISDDRRMRDPKLALDAYAEAWALNYYLIRQKPKQYVRYLQMLAEKKPLVWDDPATRVEEFESAFGELSALDGDFLRQMEKVR